MRRRRHEEHVNHEAWAIPYADLLTLLLAFFVVMYAVSVVNEGKYREMSESIIEAFNGTARHVAPARGQVATPVVPVPARQAGAAPPVPLRAPLALPLPSSAKAVAPKAAPARAAPAPAPAQRNLARIRDEVNQALQPLIDKHLVIVRPSKDWLEIEIRTDILFPSGVARLSDQADEVLRKLAGIMAPFPNPLRVEGYTDDVPIDTAVYPSNWELSAARAASVARLFAEHGVEPARLGIIGWGEYRPAAPNDTSEGRNRNRRVLVVVLGDHRVPARFGTDARSAGQLAQDDTSPAVDDAQGASPPVLAVPDESAPGSVGSPLAKAAPASPAAPARRVGGHG
jgi:chemotaxis protein MotB